MFKVFTYDLQKNQKQINKNKLSERVTNNNLQLTIEKQKKTIHKIKFGKLFIKLMKVSKSMKE